MDLLIICCLVYILSSLSFQIRKSLSKISKYKSPERVSSTSTFDTFEENHTTINDDNLNKLEKLLKEREVRRIEFIAADIAVKKYENVIETSRKNENNILFKSTYDYGFSSKSNGISNDNRTPDGGLVPSNALILASENFKREFKNIYDTIFHLNNKDEKSYRNDVVREKLLSLQLSNKDIWDREHARPEVKAPWVIKLPYYILCVLLDNFFVGKPIYRFYFLETVARMPYFSYITMIHMYETLGWWRNSIENKRIHFAQEYNEYHHLLIMESLGGDQEWFVRFLAQHASIVYYFIMVTLWVLSPTLAYNFSELIESHAVDTYT